MTSGCTPSGWEPLTAENAPACWPAFLLSSGDDLLLWCEAPASYDFEARTWIEVPTDGAPEPSLTGAVAWTGDLLLVWGGVPSEDGYSPYASAEASGALFDTNRGQWFPMSRDGAPEAVADFASAWTGSELLVWGGRTADGRLVDSGGRYDPATDDWTPMAEDNAPRARLWPHVGWTGRELVVWGGLAGDRVEDVVSPSNQVVEWFSAGGARYDPANDVWTALETEPPPQFSAWGKRGVWTGGELVFYEGRDVDGAVVGARYATDGYDWHPLEDAAWDHIVWTGEHVLGWRDRELGTYDEQRDEWAVSRAPPATYTATAARGGLYGWPGTENPPLGPWRVVGEGWIYTP